MKKRNGQHKVEPVREIAGEEVGVSVESSGGNGQRPGVGIPGSEDVFAAISRGGANMVREMLTGSGKPEEYLPRTRIEEEEIGMNCRILGMLQAFDTGLVEVPSIIAFKCNARIGLNGLGRGEAVQMIVAENKRLSHMLSRLQGNQGQGREGMST